MSSADALKRDNARFMWHSMAHPCAMEAHPPDIVVRGEGCWIWDIHGHKLLDGVGGLWCSNLGHSNARVRDAIVAQLDTLPFYHGFRGTSHVTAIALSKRLVGMMEREQVSAVMFSSGGSDAVETALKLARQYHRVGGQQDRTKFISLKQGYHGVHFGGASVNGMTSFRRPYEPLLPGRSAIDTPWLYYIPYTHDPIALGEICAGLLEREILFQGPETVAAFIAEPVQGFGGVIVPPPNYWPLVREICDRHGVLLIADEVVTGFGRTGELFGTRLWGVNADIWCLAKGISSGYVPLSATAVGLKVARAFRNDLAGAATVTHGYTYSAHPLAAAAAMATFDVIEELDLPARVRVSGAHFQSRLRDLAERFELIGDVRGIGLMAGIEMVADKASRVPLARASDLPARVARAAYARGAMVRVSGANLILSPPLVISIDEINELIDIVEASFAEVCHSPLKS